MLKSKIFLVYASRSRYAQNRKAQVTLHHLWFLIGSYHCLQNRTIIHCTFYTVGILVREATSS